MENIHLKNLNSEKTLKELAKNPKAYLFYVFQQNVMLTITTLLFIYSKNYQ